MVLCEDTRQAVGEFLQMCTDAMESKGLWVSRKNTEYPPSFTGRLGD